MSQRGGKDDYPEAQRICIRLQGKQWPIHMLALPSRTCTLRLQLGRVAGGLNASARWGKERRQIIIVLRAQDAVKEPYSAPPPVIDRRCATRRGFCQGWELSVLGVHGGASQSGLGKRCQAGPRRFR